MSEPETALRRTQRLFLPRLEEGQGPKLGFLAGFGGLPRWIPFLDALARERTVIVPSLPGFPGRRARAYRARQPSRLGARGAPAAAEGGARRRRSGRQLGRRLVCRRDRGDLAGLGPPAGVDRAVGPVRRKGPDDRSLGAAGRPMCPACSAPIPSAGTRSRPSPKARIRRNGRSSRCAPTRPRPASSGRSAIPGSKSGCR